MTTPPHVSVCICTFRRPAMLQRLLETLARQETRGAATFDIVVADNDPAGSAQSVVAAFAAQAKVRTTYCHEPRQNIALARNATIRHSQGDFIAFLDDDEFPAEGWLAQMLAACERYQAAGILGPVRPHFDEPPPRWIVKGGFCERPEPPTGTVMDWEKCRTGNVLFRRSILDGVAQPFLEKFGSGGEDKDFFLRMTQKGGTFVWCNEAVAYESVPPSRWTRRYMLQRALLRGRIVLKHPEYRTKLLAQSCLAVPVYSLILPVTLLIGQHVFMKYCIKFCDHLGRILTVLGANPVKERQM